ncbi:MAG: hemerythrin domain-containing protein [Chloroflexi bacterium]|nr:hemerythrin domain-containing protein [Chloroflexota bacterium]
MSGSDGLGHPIDVMYLIHKALRSDASRVVAVAESLEAGDSLQSFKLAFNTWATALIYHAEQEDRHIAEKVKTQIAALEEDLHQELVESIQDVLNMLNDEIGKTSVIARTKNHLHRQVVALSVAQEDHLETEESLVLPVVRRQMSERQQLELARDLLLDREADDPRWGMDWVVRDLEPSERESLARMEQRFEQLPTPAA